MSLFQQKWNYIKMKKFPTKNELLNADKLLTRKVPNENKNSSLKKWNSSQDTQTDFPGCLYVSGGAILEDGDGIELVQKFDVKTGLWTETTGMLIPRSGSAACFLNGFIYVIGNILFGTNAVAFFISM
jgi:hypothetical protein